ncbi:MAG TPA: hypothetical protein VGU66_15450 [Candidatus Elarobacter sp.]|nr:hypothetical protein [Candidatus Elarobacter sp.]
MRRLSFGAAAATRIQRVAVALKLTDGGRHTGIVFRDGGRLLFTHVGWHYTSIIQPFSGDEYHWMNPDTTDTEDNLIASYCRSVASAYKKGLPYAIERSAVIGSGGVVTITRSGGGFTCATFVMDMFAGAGVTMFDESTWKVFPEDVAEQQRVVDLMKTWHIDARHIALQQSRVGRVVRFRPEDVAAGCAMTCTAPNAFTKVRPVAEQLVAELLSAQE